MVSIATVVAKFLAASVLSAFVPFNTASAVASESNLIFFSSMPFLAADICMFSLLSRVLSRKEVLNKAAVPS